MHGQQADPSGFKRCSDRGKERSDILNVCPRRTTGVVCESPTTRSTSTVGQVINQSPSNEKQP